MSFIAEQPWYLWPPGPGVVPDPTHEFHQHPEGTDFGYLWHSAISFPPPSFEYPKHTRPARDVEENNRVTGGKAPVDAAPIIPINDSALPADELVILRAG